MTRVRIILLTAVCAVGLSQSASTAAEKPKAHARKCPADKVTVGGRDVLEVLKMLGAKRDAGAADKQLAAYAAHFDRSDPNRDGKHSKKEYIEDGTFMTPQARRGIFAAADNNADGAVTRVEYVLNRIITDEAKGIVQRTDADKDGKIVKAEFVSGSPLKDKSLAAAVFDALDTNGDGTITIPEYLRVWGGWARPNYKDQEAAISARLAKLGKGDKGGKSTGGPPSVERIFKIMDRDKDGKLTGAEFRGPKHVFTAADKNKDGLVTRQEMDAFRGRTGGPGAKDKPKGGPKVKPKPPDGAAASIEEVFKVIDRDGDGKLSRGELRRVVRAADADGDGLVTLKELTDLGRTGGGRKGKQAKGPGR